jgi:hypothetical protein
VISAEGKPNTRHIAAVGGARRKNEHLASRQEPLLAGVAMRPDAALADDVAEVIRKNILIPVILQRAQLDLACLAGQNEFLRKT